MMSDFWSLVFVGRGKILLIKCRVSSLDQSGHGFDFNNYIIDNVGAGP